MKKGIELWGKKGAAAIMKEMGKFYDMNVFKPLKSEDITPDIREKSLGYLMFLNKKETEISKEEAVPTVGLSGYTSQNQRQALQLRQLNPSS